MATVKANYDCAQNVVYSAVETLWANYLEDLAHFTEYKPYYDEDTATNALAANEAAEDMTDAAVNVAIAEEIGIDVKKLAEIVLTDYQKTKGYINKAFAKEYQNANYTQAGHNYYAKAQNNDWEAVKSLGEANHTYISNVIKKPLLEANENMPSAFIDTVNTNNENFQNKYNAYKTAKNTGDSTDAKITATNNSHTTTMDMLADAAIIFRSNPTLAARYIWDTTVTSIDPKAEGIKGTAKNSITSLPVPVTIVAKSEGNPAITFVSTKDGKFKQILAHAKYTFTITSPGYKTQTIEKEVLLHTMSRFNLLMTPE